MRRRPRRDTRASRLRRASRGFSFGGWAPGVEPTVFLPPLGRSGPNGRFLLQMHYGPTPVEESDLTEFNLFCRRTGAARVELSMMTPANLSESFFIQPNEIKTFTNSAVDEDISLLMSCHVPFAGQGVGSVRGVPSQADTR